jgi:signal transduction histidine kinase
MPFIEYNSEVSSKWGPREEQVLSDFTHDLRAPLSAIMGYLDLVSRQVGPTAPPKAVEYLTLAREAGTRMNYMVTDMLDMLRFEQGQGTLHKKRVQVPSLLRSVRHTFAGLADLKQVEFHCHADDQTPLATWADPRFLVRVFDNLVSNAIKFTPPGGTVNVIARDEGKRTVFEVIDTGRGIPSEDRKRIFEKYQHVRSADQNKGYGIGLAVVKAIVQAHQGAITVSSQIGKGSRFTFWIPNPPTLLGFN